MSSKKVDISNCRKVISIETKKEIIKKYEGGAKQRDLAIEYGLHKNTIQTILSKKDKIKKANVAKGVSRLTPLRKPLGDQMENLLLVWLEERQVKGFPTCQGLIRKKAKMIYEDLKGRFLNEGLEMQEFRASRGWFSKFCKRAGLSKINIQEEIKPAEIKLQNMALNDGTPTALKLAQLKTDSVEEQDVPPPKEKKTSENSTFDTNTEEVLLQHQNPFIFEELQALAEVAEEELKIVQKQIPVVEEVVKDYMPTNFIKELLQKWEEVWTLVCQWHPNQSKVTQVGNAFEEVAISHFRVLLEERREQIHFNQHGIRGPHKQENSVDLLVNHGKGTKS